MRNGGLGHLQELTVRPISLEIRNEAVEGKTIKRNQAIGES